MGFSYTLEQPARRAPEGRCGAPELPVALVQCPMETNVHTSRHRFVVALALVVTACAAASPDVHAQSTTTFVPVTDAMLQQPSPDDWLMWRRTLDGWGYSPLDQIDRQNVGDLRLVWSRALSAGGRQQGTPLVYNGVMYMPNPERCHSGDRRRDRRPHLGVSSVAARRRV